MRRLIALHDGRWAPRRHGAKARPAAYPARRPLARVFVERVYRNGRALSRGFFGAESSA